MSATLQRVAFGLLAGFLALALAAGYWGLLRAEDLAGRVDNPRFVIAETRIRRGPIYDRTGAVLAMTEGVPGSFTRTYPLPAAAPVTGYATLRYGVSGIEETFNSLLRGDLDPDSLAALWEIGVLGRPQIGRGVRLTLDSAVQRAAAVALGADVGAVVLLDPLTGDVLALVSSPTFDPNRLEADWETLVADARAPLLNRATFGSYQPGGALQALVLAAALERGVIGPDSVFADGDRPFAWPGGSLECLSAPQTPLTPASALAAACPAAFAALGPLLGAGHLENALADFGLYTAPQFSLPAVASERVPIPADAPGQRLAAAGQGALRVSPLHVALAAAALANRGVVPPLRLVVEYQDGAGAWQPQDALGHARAAVGASTAAAVAGLLPRLPLAAGQAAAGHAAPALTGPEAEPLAWYLGFAPADNPRLALAVLVENAPPERAVNIALEAFEAALNR